MLAIVYVACLNFNVRDTRELKISVSDVRDVRKSSSGKFSGASMSMWQQ